MSVKELIIELGGDITEIERVKRKYPMKVSPHYLGLVRTKGDPIWRQCIPSAEELDDTYNIDDPLAEGEHEHHGYVVHKYPDRALLLVSSKCAMYCRFCTRKRRVGRVSQIPLEEIFTAIGYIEAHPEIRDVIVSGGDPLMRSDQDLEAILSRLRAIPHVEIIRIGTRIPCVMPSRVTKRLANMLRRYHPLYVNTHFNHPMEITAESERACAILADAGIPLGNQAVLLRGVNDSPGVIRELMQKLIRMRVKPYYIYQCDLVRGVEHFRIRTEEGLTIMKSLQGFTSGLCLPHFVIDGPGGKIPISPQYIKDISSDQILLSNYRDVLYSYPNPRSPGSVRGRWRDSWNGQGNAGQGHPGQHLSPGAPPVDGLPGSQDTARNTPVRIGSEPSGSPLSEMAPGARESDTSPAGGLASRHSGHWSSTTPHARGNVGGIRKGGDDGDEGAGGKDGDRRTEGHRVNVGAGSKDGENAAGGKDGNNRAGGRGRKGDRGPGEDTFGTSGKSGKNGTRRKPPAARSMKIGLIYNIKRIPARDERFDTYSEFDEPATIDAIRRALEAGGHTVIPCEANSDLVRKLTEHDIEFVFNIAEGMHGGSREAQVPAILDMLAIPYAGSGVLTQALTLDKVRCKQILLHHSIPTPRYQIFFNGKRKIDPNLRFPLIVKPNFEGSSKGITNDSLVFDPGSLRDRVRSVIKNYHQPALVEEFCDGREFTVAVIGNTPPRVLPIVEITYHHLPEHIHPFDSHEVKWIYDSPESGVDPLRCPATLPPRLRSRIEKVALDTFAALDCADFCRIDIRLDSRGVPNVLDVNALPGLIPDPRENSRFPRACFSADMTYDEMILAMLHVGLKRNGLLRSM